MRSIICSITPGGGTSLLPVIAANILLPSIADRVALFLNPDAVAADGARSIL